VSFEPTNFAELLALEPHGPDTFVGASPPYEWGRIYGGQVIAQALWAAMETVPAGFAVHSLHVYFILGGRLDEPVRFEVDRTRNGRSFTTRQVVARQSYGAILSLQASFQRDEHEADVQTVKAPHVRGPEHVEDVGWGWMLERRQIPAEDGTGRVFTWLRVDPSVGDDPRRQACALAFASDTSTVTSARAVHPRGGGTRDEQRERFMGASLDHAIWFHRPTRADEWFLVDMSSQGLRGGRGLALGYIFDAAGAHVATIAQEALLRERRSSGDGPMGDISGTE